MWILFILQTLAGAVPDKKDKTWRFATYNNFEDIEQHSEDT